MNLIDAIKSGRPFRRRVWAERCAKQDWWRPDSWSKSFLKQDILADDWEIQEPPPHEALRRLVDSLNDLSTYQRPGPQLLRALELASKFLKENEEPSVTITASQLEQAVLTMWEGEEVDWDKNEEAWRSVAKVLARKLGLEPK